MAKPFARQFYSSKTWQECRNGYAAYRHHLCESCLERGLFTPGVIVHHIVELTPDNIKDPNITLNWDNLRLVCRRCHAEEHGQDGYWNRVNEQRKKAKASRMRYVVDANGTVTAR